MPEMPPARPNDQTALLNQQQAFGYTQEDIQFFLEPMAQEGDDPVGSMGTDTPLAVLSNKPKLLYNYFKQNFAQVTNPPIDPIREELVMSLVSMIGPRPNLLGHHAGSHYRLEVAQPILTNADLEKVRAISSLAGDAFRTQTIDVTWPASEGAAGMARAVDRICSEATDAVLDGYNILILSDRAVSADAHPDAGAAGDGGGASPPDPPRPAHQHRAWWWRPARRARCIISACSRATARRRSIPTSRSRRWSRSACRTSCARSPTRCRRTTSRRSARAS